jgi:TatD DNase family protein
MLVDTHAHVNFRSFKDDAKEVLQRALDNDVQVINIGSQIDTSRQAVELANQFNFGVYAVVGLHPEHTHSQHVDEEETHFLTREEKFDVNLYRTQAENSKVVGIGECGLDYYRLPEGVDQNLIKAKQKEAFRAQLKLAKELDKVLVVHSRSSKGTDDAVLDILEILKQESGIMNYELRFEVHSYTGSPETLSKFIDLGGYASFNGIITFDKTGNMEKLVKMTPLDRILLETDCPYLSPVPMRGKRNEPGFVKFVAEKVGQLKGLSVDEVAVITTSNAKKLFRI